MLVNVQVIYLKWYAPYTAIQPVRMSLRKRWEPQEDIGFYCSINK